MMWPSFRVIWRVPLDATETAREWPATHLSEGSTTSGIVDDVSDNTFDVTMTLGVVLRREGGVGGSGTAFQMTGNECRVREKKTRVARRCVLDVALGEVHRRQEIPRIDALHMC